MHVRMSICLKAVVKIGGGHFTTELYEFRFSWAFSNPVIMLLFLTINAYILTINALLREITA